MSKLITVSPSPHIHGGNSIEKLMYGVVVALIPAFLFSVMYFGIPAIIVTLTSVVSCILIEFLIQKFIMKIKPTIGDGSAIVTGLLLGFNLPATMPVWMIFIGSVIAIGVAKMSFGGLGNNPFNPALVGRVFLLVSFPVQMTSFPKPMGFDTSYIDSESGATPLSLLKEGLNAGETMPSIISKLPGNNSLFFGDIGGSLGEVAALALLLGLVYMLIRKVITWHIPVTIILTVFFFTAILWLANPDTNANPLFHLMSGGLLLGAVFMATDYVTSPMLPKSMVIYGVGIGVLTVVIRVWGAYPEGISFAILIMNAFVPLLNRYIKPKRFGEVLNNG